MSVFWVQVSSVARLTAARPSAKTNTSELVFFILLPFQNSFLHQQELPVFSWHTLRAPSLLLICLLFSSLLVLSLSLPYHDESLASGGQTVHTGRPRPVSLMLGGVLLTGYFSCCGSRFQVHRSGL